MLGFGCLTAISDHVVGSDDHAHLILFGYLASYGLLQNSSFAAFHGHYVLAQDLDLRTGMMIEKRAVITGSDRS